MSEGTKEAIAMLRVFLIVAAMCAPASADEPLNCLLEKSELVVSGEIIEPPMVWNSEAGVNHYGFKFRVSKTLKGKAGADEIGVVFTRVELRNDERLPYFKKGAHLIFFLRHGQKDKGEPDCWIEADSWFGVQLYNRVLERSLQELAKE
jgi:hypothetical protein